MTMLSTQGLRKEFAGLVAVSGLDLAVERGSIVGLIGPNGAGKSTVFNLISGVLAPTAGRVRFEGQDITGLRPERVLRRGLARTFQNVRLFSSMTVAENVMLARAELRDQGLIAGGLGLGGSYRRLRWARESAVRMLRMVGLADQADRLASELPFGQQRLLEVARVMAAEPKLVMLDEPAAGLNRQERRELLSLIRFLRDRGMTVLLVEHDVDLVLSVVETVYVLDQGELIAVGPPDMIRRDERVIEAYLG